jgi:hypothetical protein
MNNLQEEIERVVAAIKLPVALSAFDLRSFYTKVRCLFPYVASRLGRPPRPDAASCACCPACRGPFFFADAFLDGAGCWSACDSVFSLGTGVAERWLRAMSSLQGRLGKNRGRVWRPGVVEQEDAQAVRGECCVLRAKKGLTSKRRTFVRLT